MRFSRLRVGEVVGYRRRMYDPYTKQPVRFDAPGLRVRSVDLERKLIDVYGKGQREDIAEMDGKTAGLIRRLITTLTHQEPDAPLFQLPDGRPKGTKWAFARFRALCRTAGIQRHLTLHMLGHTFLTRFLEHGGNLKAAQRLARHRNLDSTLIYADYVRDGALRREFDQHNVDTDPDR